MIDPQTDVNAVEPSTTETTQVVNSPETDQQAVEQTETEQTQTPSSSQEVNQESNVDERGVPLVNVKHEFDRKLSETQAQIQQLASLIQTSQSQQQPVQNQISDDQLLWCVEDPNATPEAKFYAKNELRKRDEIRQDKKLKEVFNNYTEEQSVKQQRSQAFGWFASNFSDAVVKDISGNPVSLDSNHPLVQRMNMYMQDPMAAKRGDALMIAAKNAAFDLGYVANKGLNNKLRQTAAQLKKEQKKTLIAGNGVNPQDQGTPINKTVEEYRKTQNPNAFHALAKKRGLIPSDL